MFRMSVSSCLSYSYDKNSLIHAPPLCVSHCEPARQLSGAVVKHSPWLCDGERFNWDKEDQVHVPALSD